MDLNGYYYSRLTPVEIALVMQNPRYHLLYNLTRGIETLLHGPDLVDTWAEQVEDRRATEAILQLLPVDLAARATVILVRADMRRFGGS
jgi:hypothetical protein